MKRNLTLLGPLWPSAAAVLQKSPSLPQERNRWLVSTAARGRSRFAVLAEAG